MGIGPFYRKYEGCVSYPSDTTIADPKDFQIVRAYSNKNACAVLVNYPAAKNYEGNKIMVYRAATEKRVRSAKELDPHFTKTGLSPFARFEPTPAGWQAACALVDALSTGA